MRISGVALLTAAACGALLFSGMTPFRNPFRRTTPAEKSPVPPSATPSAASLVSSSVSPKAPAGEPSEASASPSVPGKPRGPSLDERFLFFPSRYPQGNWQPLGLEHEDVEFQAADGTKLHAWYCPVEKPRAVVLMMHGNGGHLADRAEWMRYLQTKMALSVLMFDYRGYGKSEGVPTVDGILQDARAARTVLANQAGVAEGDLVLMGESLGGAVAVQLAAESPARGLVLQSTFSSLRDVASTHYRGLSWLVPKQKLNSAEAITRYHGPLLQSHGDHDRVIALDSAKALFKAANEPKQLLILPNVDHNNWLCADYLKALNEFLSTLER